MYLSPDFIDSCKVTEDPILSAGVQQERYFLKFTSSLLETSSELLLAVRQGHSVTTSGSSTYCSCEVNIRVLRILDSLFFFFSR